MKKGLREEVAKLRKDFDYLNGLVQKQDGMDLPREMELLRQEVTNVLYKLKSETERKLLEFEKNQAEKYIKFLMDVLKNK